jgi:hypothetical protein
MSTAENIFEIEDASAADNYLDTMNHIDPRTGYAYNEMKEASDLWHKSLDRAIKKGDFDGLGKYITDDCEMTFCIPGIDPNFFARPLTVKGKAEVLRVIKANQVLGVPSWSYTWRDCFIDPRKAFILYVWDETSPYQKKDGTCWKNGNFGTTRLHYAGSYQVNNIVDITDTEYRLALKEELIAAGIAPQEMIDEMKAYKAVFAEDQKVWKSHIDELRKNAK